MQAKSAEPLKPDPESQLPVPTQRSSKSFATTKVPGGEAPLRRELTAIFRELKDPRVAQGLISIVRVEVTNDLSVFDLKHLNAIVSELRAKPAVSKVERVTG